MASKAIRRRTISAEAVKTSETRMEAMVSGSTTEPLLQDPTRVHDDKPKTQEPASWSGFWDKTRRKCLRWAHLLSIFIAQSAGNIVNVITDLGSLLGRLFGYGSGPQSSRVGQTVPINLSPVQEERLRSLRQRLGVPYDCSSVKHQDALKELWRLAYPNRELPSLKSDLWKEMGWQNCDPSTDFRAGGFMSLENLIYFARNYPDSFQRLLHKKDGNRAEWEYPFAVAGVNISYMLVQMLDLQTGNMSTKAAMHFVRLLEGDDSAFDNLFCVAFQMLDAEWLKRRATYMEFNEVMKSTRVQLEQELSIGDISRVQDMPSFRTLER